MTRVQSRKHLDFIRSLPCCVPGCRDNTTTEAAHIRYSDGRIAKVNPGNGAKPNDCYTVPLCGKHHRASHLWGDEESWWIGYRIDPVLASLALYAHSGDYEAGCKIIEALRG